MRYAILKAMVVFNVKLLKDGHVMTCHVKRYAEMESWLGQKNVIQEERKDVLMIVRDLNKDMIV